MSVFRLATRSVVAAFASPQQAGEAIRQIRPAGVYPVDVSVLGLSGAWEQAVPKPGKGPLRALGKITDWIGGGRSFAVEGLGTLVGTGPVAEVLATGGHLTLTGALVMQGIPIGDARAYEEAVRADRIVVQAGVADRVVGERVYTAFSQAGGDSIGYHAGRPYGTAFHGAGPGLQ